MMNKLEKALAIAVRDCLVVKHQEKFSARFEISRSRLRRNVAGKREE